MSKEIKTYKKLFKNVGLMTISSLGTKILNILLVPLYTSILTTSEYGIYDIYSTLSALALPIITCNIADAVFRFSIDEENDKNQVFSIGVLYLVRAAILFSVVVFAAWGFGLFAEVIRYPFILIIYFILHMLYEFMIRFIRGLERISDIAVGGILNTLSLVCFNVLFLLNFHLGLKGYFCATFLAYLIPIIYFVFRTKIWKYFTIKKENWVEKKMRRYSFPLLFDSIAWWINNASDRYIVTWICGLSVNGIYSMAYKIPTLINTVQNIFNQAWMISAIDEYRKGNHDFLKKTYRGYKFLLLFSCSILIVLDKLIARLFLANDFYMAWVYAPFLMIAVMFGGLSAFMEGIFAAAKETNHLAKTTMMGAVINIILNAILVSKYGALGAAFSTMASYFVVWFTREYGLKKRIGISLLGVRDVVEYLLVLMQACLRCIIDADIFTICGILVLLVASNLKEFRVLCNKLFALIKIAKVKITNGK